MKYLPWIKKLLSSIPVEKSHFNLVSSNMCEPTQLLGQILQGESFTQTIECSYEPKSGVSSNSS